jgi:AcrR family transcriptional regulator
MSSTAAVTKTDVVKSFRRTQILDAARDRFTRKGVGNTTVEDIARAAHVAKGTVYLYYKSKDEMLRLLLDTDIEELCSVTVPAIAGPGDLEARLRGFFERTLCFYERNREFIEHCQLELSPDVRKKTQVTLGRCYQAQVDAWVETLSDALARGDVATDWVEGVARSIVSLARGMAQQRLAGWGDEPIGTTAERAAALVLRGLATR